MPDFEKHNLQANNNIKLVNEISEKIQDYNDWKVTILFYSALHIVNAHIAKSIDGHYQTHMEVQNALNPFFLSPARIENEPYVAYKMLQNLSRRSRYLVHEDKHNEDSTRAHYTSEKHFQKAINRMNEIKSYFEAKYRISYENVL